MSVTPGLGAFNKDKVANKFGIQLKNKDTNKQSLSSSIEEKIINTETSTVTKNKTVSDFRVQNQSNGFQLNTNISKTSQPIKKTLENLTKSKSSIALLSTSMDNERRDSLNSNVNHSKSSNPVKTNQSMKSNSQSLSKSPDTVKRSNVTPIDQNKSSESSSIKQTNIKKSTERAVSPVSPLKRSSVPTTTNKTEAEIEHQKDQPLYKRQLSKTLENATSMANKHKHQHELTTISTSR